MDGEQTTFNLFSFVFNFSKKNIEKKNGHCVYVDSLNNYFFLLDDNLHVFTFVKRNINAHMIVNVWCVCAFMCERERDNNNNKNNNFCLTNKKNNLERN